MHARGRRDGTAARLPGVFDLHELVKTVSYLGLFAIVFAETGLLAGFFLPGDSLLITAGLVAAEGILSLPVVVLVCTTAAIVGDSTGYWIGSRFGTRLFNRPKSRWFDPAHVEKARAYFDRYGPRTLVVARFVPIVRTFAPTVAGVARMDYRTFLLWNVIGGVLWGAGVPVAGYYLGQLIPNLEKYLLLVIGVVIVLSVVPIALELRSSRRAPRPE